MTFDGVADGLRGPWVALKFLVKSSVEGLDIITVSPVALNARPPRFRESLLLLLSTSLLLSRKSLFGKLAEFN